MWTTTVSVVLCNVALVIKPRNCMWRDIEKAAENRLLCPCPLSGGIKRWCCLTSDVCLSVAYIGPKSRKERPRKIKIGTEVSHVTRDSDITFKVKGQGHRGGAYCGGLPHSLLIQLLPVFRYSAIKLQAYATVILLWHFVIICKIHNTVSWLKNVEIDKYCTYEVRWLQRRYAIRFST